MQKEVYRNSTPLSTAELIANRRAAMPGSYRRQYDSAMSGKSLRAAINARCLDCCNWERTEVKACPAVACPLHPVRPYQPSSKKKNPMKQDFSDCEPILEPESMNSEEGVG